MKLYQIVDLLRNLIDHKDVIFNNQAEEKLDGKMKELFLGLESGEFKSDEDASQALFGKGPDYPYYFEIKAKFRDQLLKNLFHLNLRSSKFHDYYRQELECEVMLQQAKILLRSGLVYNAVWLFKRTLKTAESYHFTTIMKECYRNLKNQMVYDGNIKKYEEYQKSWRKSIEIEEAELEADDLIAQVRVRGQKSVKENRTSVELAKTVLERITLLREKYDTPVLIQKYYFIAALYCERTANWNRSIALADELAANSNLYPDKYAAIRMKNVHVLKLYAYILLGRIEEGLDYVNEVISEYRLDEGGYFIFLEDYYLLNMRAGLYEKALEVVELATENKYFENIHPLSKERWDIYREYALCFCNIESSNDISLINHFPEYSKDKLGFNLQILILPILILLKSGKIDMLHNHIERLRMYEVRQISKAENRRAQYFIRLLGQLSHYDLNYEKCKKQGNKYFNLLKQFPEKDEPYTEVEIVSYETLWQSVLQLLKEPHLIKS